MTVTQGLASRRSALRLLDAVLRRGETIEQAETGALRELVIPADRGLARSMASEVLRWLVDLDALIDSATRQNLHDDSSEAHSSELQSLMRISYAVFCLKNNKQYVF